MKWQHERVVRCVEIQERRLDARLRAVGAFTREDVERIHRVVRAGVRQRRARIVERVRRDHEVDQRDGGWIATVRGRAAGGHRGAVDLRVLVGGSTEREGGVEDRRAGLCERKHRVLRPFAESDHTGARHARLPFEEASCRHDIL